MGVKKDIDSTVLRMWPGSTVVEIAEAAGVDRWTVSRRAAALGLPGKARPYGLDDAIQASWATSTPEAIAKAANVEVATVKRRARALGLLLAKPPEPKKLAGPRLVSGGNLKRKLEARVDDGPRLELAPLPPVRPPGPKSRILADALPGSCRFPVGETPETRADLQLFCGEPAEGNGCPYCAGHAALAYLSKRSKK